MDAPHATEDPSNEGLDWDALYKAHARAIGRYLMKLVRDDATAADLVQDAFIRAMRAEDQLADRSAVRAWLYRIASNVAIEHLRRRRLLAFLPFLGHEADERDVSDPEIDHVRRALAAISPAQAVTLVLCLQEGFSRRDAANVLGVSEETVKSRIARGRVAFARAYERLGGGSS